jgi:hypothetical protein
MFVDQLLSTNQVTTLANLLGAVSNESRLGRTWCDEADYWAGQVAPRLEDDDAQNIGWLLDDVAGSPWVSDPMRRRARGWSDTIMELAGGPDPEEL